MSMQVPLGICFAVCRLLVEAHAVGEADLEQLVVAPCHPPQNVGQAIAGVVSVQTKSGTNELHGSAFEFLQRDRFQARNPFTQPDREDPLTGRVLPQTKRDQFGASIGGPLKQNKFFFFADYQGTRANIGGSRLLTVPTAAARTGDLSAYGVNIFDPAAGAPGSRPQFGGMRISHPSGLHGLLIG